MKKFWKTLCDGGEPLRFDTQEQALAYIYKHEIRSARAEKALVRWVIRVLR